MNQLSALIHDGAFATGAATLLYSTTVSITALVVTLAAINTAATPPVTSSPFSCAAHRYDQRRRTHNSRTTRHCR
ncbi:hypothetical protein [Virgisporangium aurantiacum]|uniref:hypothetical protein n=1 Tax=Virgisporangium aurantiacum TaxID=175570 RepID=UPI0019525639|nr:hypothetical protein [Virgisporangium aurantiacum]